MIYQNEQSEHFGRSCKILRHVNDSTCMVEFQVGAKLIHTNVQTVDLVDDLDAMHDAIDCDLEVAEFELVQNRLF